MKLTEVIAIWEELHVKDPGEIGYCDLENAVEKIVGIENDIDSNQPTLSRLQTLDNTCFIGGKFFHLARKYAEEADELQKQLQNEPRLKHVFISELLDELIERHKEIRKLDVVIPRQKKPKPNPEN